MLFFLTVVVVVVPRKGREAQTNKASTLVMLFVLALRQNAIVDV